MMGMLYGIALDSQVFFGFGFGYLSTTVGQTLSQTRVAHTPSDIDIELTHLEARYAVRSPFQSRS